jgi:hypothetical protein
MSKVKIDARTDPSCLSFIIVLQAGSASPDDSLEFLANRYRAESRCQLRETEEEREEVIYQEKGGTTS